MVDVASVLLAGGGTAGHVNPLLAVADELRRRHPDGRFAVLGTAEGLESRLVPEHGYDLALVPRVPLPRRPTVDWFRLPGRLGAAVRAAQDAIEAIDAQVVVGFGGYVATPAYLAARRCGVPVVVHEQNARPGLANRLGARTAAAVAVTFEGTALPGAVVTGLPLRTAVADLVQARSVDAAGARRAGAQALGLDPDLPTLLVTGGSLGAVSVNRAVAGAAASLLATGAQVLHLTGRGKSGDVQEAVTGVPGAERYHVLEYLTQMERALAVADVVVGRAGAGTVCELAALGVPAVYVPLPVGNGEQRLNARGVVDAGGGVLVEDRDLTSPWVAEHVTPLLAGDEGARVRDRMAQAAARVGVRDAAARVALLVEEQLPERLRVLRPVAPQVPRPGPAVPDPGERGPVTLDDLGRVHLVGVGGAGMSAIAPLLAARGLRVSGSDAHEGPALAGLRAAGVEVHVGHDARLVEDVDTLVVSSAVRASNPEVERARERDIPVLHRSEALAALMADRDAVAVAGAHGKTTTSGMVAAALVHAGADPSFAIGGVVRATAGTLGAARHGGGPFVAEADESDGSFLAYEPLVAVVTNVEPDHLDHYGSRERFEAAFERFADRVRDGGLLVACADDAGAVRLVAAVRERLTARGVAVRTYGTDPGADVRVGEGVRASDGRWEVVLTPRDEPPVTVHLRVAGAHNALDAAAAWCALRRVGLDAQAAAAGLGDFVGTGRRFEERGTADGVRVVDDYAHHPTEVVALLRAARQVAGDGRVLVLFQPHLYSRTRTFAQEFGAAFDLADEVVVMDVYAAREDPDPSVSGATIVDRVPTAGRARYVPDRLDAARAVAAAARPGDLLLTVGAGDVTELASVVLADLAARAQATGDVSAAGDSPGGAVP